MQNFRLWQEIGRKLTSLDLHKAGLDKSNAKKSDCPSDKRRQSLKGLLRNPIAIAVMAQLLANLIWTVGGWVYAHAPNILHMIGLWPASSRPISLSVQTCPTDYILGFAKDLSFAAKEVWTPRYKCCSCPIGRELLLWQVTPPQSLVYFYYMQKGTDFIRGYKKISLLHKKDKERGPLYRRN